MTDAIRKAAQAWAWDTYRYSGRAVCSAAEAGYEEGHEAGWNAALEQAAKVADGLKWYSQWPMDGTVKEPAAVVYNADVAEAIRTLRGPT